MIDPELRRRWNENRDQDIIIERCADSTAVIVVLAELVEHLTAIERSEGGEPLEFIYDFQGPTIGPRGPELSLSVGPDIGEHVLDDTLDWLEQQLISVGEDGAYLTTIHPSLQRPTIDG